MKWKAKLEIDEKQIRSTIFDNQSGKKKLNSPIVVEWDQNLVEALQLSFEKMANKMKQDVSSLIKKLELVEIVTTLGELILKNRAGSRVGLIVTKGYETSVFNGQKISPLLQPDLVVGFDEKIDSKGRVIKEPNEDEIREAIRSLLDGGAEIIVASLKNSALNPHNEILCEKVMEKNFPRHYLGGVPFQKSADITDYNDITLRTYLAVVNAYIRSGLASRLYSLADELWKMGYRNLLHLIDARGHSVPLSKVLPLATLATENTAPLRD